MTQYTQIVYLVCMLCHTALSIWLITRFKHLLSGLLGTLALMGGCAAIHWAAVYIAEELVLGALFAGIIALLVFIFRGFVPGRESE